MSDACDTIPHHDPVSSVVCFVIPTSALDTPHKSCDNGEKAIEETPDDPTLTMHPAGFRRACGCLVNSTWTRMRDSLYAAQGSAPLAEMPAPVQYTLVPEGTPLGPPRNVAQAYRRAAHAFGDGIRGRLRSRGDAPHADRRDRALGR